jgi:5'(3')-deoxyribonucleotidase
MAKKRRKHSMTKRVNAGTSALLKSFKVAAVRIQSKVSDDKTQANTIVYSTKSCKPFKSDASVQRALTNVRHKWSIYCCVLCIDDRGSPYHQGQWIVSNEHYYFHSLQELVADIIEDIYNDGTKSHVVDAGWLAIPYQHEISDDKLLDIFIDIGAFDQEQQKEA